MDAIPRFTASDIEAIKEAKDALRRIDCWAVNCNTCPLHFKDGRSSGCFTNHLDYIANKAETERRLYYGN